MYGRANWGMGLCVQTRMGHTPEGVAGLVSLLDLGESGVELGLSRPFGMPWPIPSWNRRRKEGLLHKAAGRSTHRGAAPGKYLLTTLRPSFGNAM